MRSNDQHYVCHHRKGKDVSSRKEGTGQAAVQSLCHLSGLWHILIIKVINFNLSKHNLWKMNHGCCNLLWFPAKDFKRYSAVSVKQCIAVFSNLNTKQFCFSIPDYNRKWLNFPSRRNLTQKENLLGQLKPYLIMTVRSDNNFMVSFVNHDSVLAHITATKPPQK